MGKKVISLGAGEVLLTSIDKDGQKEVLTDLIKEFQRFVKFLIVSGGLGNFEHLDKLLKIGSVDDFCTKALHYNDLILKN